MVKNIMTVEYGTEVEEAWKIMHSESLSHARDMTEPRRVIGHYHLK